MAIERLTNCKRTKNDLRDIIVEERKRNEKSSNKSDRFIASSGAKKIQSILLILICRVQRCSRVQRAPCILRGKNVWYIENRICVREKIDSFFRGFVGFQSLRKLYFDEKSNTTIEKYNNKSNNNNKRQQHGTRSKGNRTR